MSEQANLSGVWEGSYAYSGDDLGRLEFRLRLKEVDGELRGIVVEPHTETDGNRKAEIEGTRRDREIQFTKIYMENGKPTGRPVTYEGLVSMDGNSMSGSWFLPDDRGTFEMERAS